MNRSFFFFSNIWKYKQYWLPDLLGVLSVLIPTIAVFHFTNLDIDVQRCFYFEHLTDKPWVLHHAIPWIWFYRYAGIATLFIGLGSFTFFILSYMTKRYRAYRIHCFFIILALSLGPGLLINLVLKEQWGRPRPRDIEEFGGRWEYRHALEKGLSGKGKSFPCGHSSVGYFLSVFYFLFRRKKRFLSFSALVISILLGTGMGIARMLAGAHFTSDVIWSGCLIFLVSWLLYYFVLNIPAREDSEDERARTPKTLTLIGGIALVVGIIVGALLATPVYEEIHDASHILTTDEEPVPITITCQECELTIHYMDIEEISVDGTSEGFGWTGSDVDFELIQTNNFILLTQEQEGFFTELATRLDIKISPRHINAISIKVDKGLVNIVSDEHNAPPLSLELDEGSCTLPQQWKGSSQMDLSVSGDRIRYQ